MAELPGWTAFDPNAPPTLSDTDDGPGRIVAVVATYLATTLGWAGRVAAELAASWSAQGHRVVLADAGLIEPQLHEVFGQPNAEGVTDAALFGASVRRIARPVRDGTFFLVSAGTAVADPDAALRSPRWTRLCESFRHAGVTLVVFVSPDEPARPWVLELATDVVVLAGPREEVGSLLDGAGMAVRGVIGVEGGAPEEAALADTWTGGELEVVPAEPTAETDVQRAPGEELPAWSEEVRKLQASAPGADEEGRVSAEAVAPTRPEPPAATRRAPRRAQSSGRRNVTLLVLLLILLAVLAAGVLGYVEIPGITPASVAPPLTDAPLEVVARSVPQAEITPPVGYSVALGAFQDPGVAAARAEQLVREAGVLVATAPVVVDGTVFHRLLAGAARDESEARSLLDRIAATSTLRRQDLALRQTPLAFRLGEHADLPGAEAHVRELQGREVPAYVLAVSYEDGAVRYRIYAGAYADTAEAEYLSARLAERGLREASLTLRTGRVPE